MPHVFVRRLEWPRSRLLCSSGREAVIRSCALCSVISGLASPGCADVLDVPSHPHLAASVTLADAGSGVPSPAPESAAQVGMSPAAPPPAQEGERPAAPEGSAGALPLTAAGSEPAQAAQIGLADAGGGSSAAADGGSPSEASPPQSSPPQVPAPQPAPAPLPDPCGDGRSSGPNGDCFEVLATPASWADARQSCRALGRGWDLASIRSPEVNGFVGALAGAEAWIGASDLDAEGTWVWVSDGQTFWRGDATGSAVNGAYADWNADEPNGGGNSGCARIVPRLENTWADLECAMLRPAVCEGPPP